MAWGVRVVAARLLANSALVVAALFTGWTAGAELLPEPRGAKPPAAVAQRMDAVLWEADALWHALGMISVPYWDALTQEVVRAKLEGAGLEVTAAFDILVEVVGPNDGVILDLNEQLRSEVEAEVDEVRSVLIRNGARIHSAWMRRVSASVPIGALERVARELPVGYRLRQSLPPGLDAVYGEGPTVTNSEGYRDAGADGAGVTIGVIDVAYDSLNAAVLNGDAPGGATIVDYCTDPTCPVFGAPGPDRHGTGCVEAAYDHAPGATWRLYRIRNLTDLGSAVQDMIANADAPRIITHSLSWYNTGWADDSGAACAAALQAAQAGILFFTSAGNRAESHYQAVFAPAPGNPIPGWHRFAGGDETNDITIPANEGVTFYLQWNNDDNVTDYDLYLYDANITVELARSINVGAASFEFLTYLNTTGAPRLTHLGVRRMAGDAVEFEVFEATSSATWQYLTPGSSTTSPSNTNNRKVISVGAVHHANFGQPSGTPGLIMPYSSRGPTNGGLIAPDLCGPTNTTGFSYPGGFGGTSCATPNVAGMVAALWSAGTGVLPEVVRDAVYGWALALRDWGPAGRENTYGRGGAILPRVSADIMPNQWPNLIVWGREYTIYVGLVADGDTFTNVATVDAASVRIGPALNMAAASPVAPAAQIDLNGDARQDLLFGFRTSDAGFDLASWRGVIRGYFTNGAPFACWDTVFVLMPFRVPAMQGHVAPLLWMGPRAGREE